MENFESTDTLIEMLKDGTYKRLVMENDEAEEVDFDKIFENYKEFVSQPDHYAYLERRQQAKD